MKRILTAFVTLALATGFVNCARDRYDTANRDMVDEDVNNTQNDNMRTTTPDRSNTRVDTSFDIDPDRQPDVNIDTSTTRTDTTGTTGTTNTTDTNNTGNMNR